MSTRWRWPKTMMSLWNMSTASAPIQATEAMVKYWMSREKKVQPISLSVRLIPTRKERSMQNMEVLSWMWNLLASFFLIFLQWGRGYCLWSRFREIGSEGEGERERERGREGEGERKGKGEANLKKTWVKMVRMRPIMERILAAIEKASRAGFFFGVDVLALIS